MKSYFGSTIVLSALCLGGCTSNQPQQSTAPTNAPATNAVVQATPDRKTKAFVRGVHVVPSIDPVTLQVNNQKIGAAFGYGNASDYVAIEPDDLKINAIGAANNKISGPMPLELDKGEDLTVVVNGISGDVALLPFKHESGGPEKNQAKLTFLHAAKGLNEVEIQIDGEKFRGEVEYGEDTSYQTLKPGRHVVTISYEQAAQATPLPTPTLVPNQISQQPTPAKLRQRVTLNTQVDVLAGKVYSLIVFYDAQKLPKTRLLEDRFADSLQSAPIAN